MEVEAEIKKRPRVILITKWWIKRESKFRILLVSQKEEVKELDDLTNKKGEQKRNEIAINSFA